MQQSSNQGCLPVFLRILNIITAAGLGLAALLLIISVLQGTAAPAESSYYYVLAGLLAFIVILHLFSLVLVLSTRLKVSTEEKKSFPTFFVASLGLILWAVVVFLGEYFVRKGVNFIFMPVILILAVALPIWWFIELGRRKLTNGNTLQTWGAVSIGTTLTPIMSMVLEVLLIFLLVIVAIIFLSFQPGFLNEFSQFSQQFKSMQDMQQTQQMLEGAIKSPVVLILVLLFVSGLVPMIEELAKPLGLFIFSGKRVTPNQGFVLGMICGACFGFIESMLLLTSSMQEGLYQLVLVRVATGLLHTTTAGLTGWGFASAVSQKKTKRMILSFLAAIGLHGLWNAFGVMVGISPFFNKDLTLSFPVAATLTQIAPFVLGFLALGMIAILIVMNIHLRKTRAQEDQSILLPQPPPIPLAPPPLPGGSTFRQ
jgi:hypothetical protein